MFRRDFLSLITSLPIFNSLVKFENNRTKELRKLLQEQIDKAVPITRECYINSLDEAEARKETLFVKSPFLSQLTNYQLVEKYKMGKHCTSSGFITKLGDKILYAYKITRKENDDCCYMSTISLVEREIPNYANNYKFYLVEGSKFPTILSEIDNFIEKV